MTNPDEEFRERLLATFREEADEHLAEITQDLLIIEREGTASAAPRIEQAYRKTHSLKGAARAVKLREIESVCQNLETVFSAMKKGEFVPDAEAFDLFHEALKTARCLLLEQEGAKASAADVSRRLRALTADTKAPIPRPAGHQGVVPAAEVPGPAKAAPEGTPAPSLPVFDTRTVRVDSDKLDRLISGSDDLLSTRLFITHRMQELEEMITRFAIWRWNNTLVSNDLHRLRESSFGKQRTELPPDLVLPLQRIVEFLEYNREFVATLQHDLSVHIQQAEIDSSALEASTQTISDLIHDAVLLPIGSVLLPFNSIVREYSRNTGKQVDLDIEGGEMEMDRRILEALKDPFMHLIHNAIDHGIEYPDIRRQKRKPVRGSVRIRTVPLSGSMVNIEVSDDGAGIDPAEIRRIARERGFLTAKEEETLSDNEIVWLVFRSGLSTSAMITGISGRGLGLAIVEDTATRLGGKVSVSSTLHRGTTIRITVPVRLATLRGVVVRSGSQLYVLPMQQVRQVMRVRPNVIITENGRSLIPFQDEMISTIRLTDALGVHAGRESDDENAPVPVIILSYGAGQIACLVDEVVRVQEIVVRPLGSQLRRVKRITGAVILGDGSLALVLDPIELIQESLKACPVTAPAFPAKGMERRVLVVEDSVTSRALLQTIIERVGYRVQTATDGIEAFAMLKEQQFDIVVSDIDMPRMNGFSLTEKIRADERLSRMPVVLVTSLDSPEDRAHGVAVGADAYIVKSSFERREILDIIAGLLARRTAAGGT